ncbi:MAG: tetratricopeptide repeat protein [Gammaproteobacteria bacterium]|nr:tetratricopeptide repeat protein [Gammaproteobacteria bacterium]
MPTESAFLLAGLLFIAAALGYVFAKYGDTDEEDMTADQLNADYMKGLNYVLNEEPDRAVEVFTRMAELDDEALETHFALGSLFRKRGEVDRAIQVHQNLIARPALSKLQKYQAEAALAEDYLSAGLFDRAEAMFIGLRDTREFRLTALLRLRRIYETTREWSRAIEIGKELDRMSNHGGQSTKDIGQIAHYYCELAEAAWKARDSKEAHQQLKHANAGPSRTVRSLLIQADMARESDEPLDAIKLYKDAVKNAPDLLVEVLPNLAACYRAAAQQDALSEFFHDLIGADKNNVAAIALAAVRDPGIQNAVALQAVEDFIALDPTLRGLAGTDQFSQLGETDRIAAINRIREALRGVVSSRPGYYCRECGYACLVMQWQCPGCHSWETVRPVTKINLISGV